MKRVVRVRRNPYHPLSVVRAVLARGRRITGSRRKGRVTSLRQAPAVAG
ncbi:hypothetical protein F750_5482 [Streptomyces sp. PAMC 26508]|nr:hypothetical protein F750_5482 [Streptomyces sp. PAMC 26508]